MGDKYARRDEDREVKRVGVEVYACHALSGASDVTDDCSLDVCNRESGIF